MRRQLTTAQRLIVAADFKPTPIQDGQTSVSTFSELVQQEVRNKVLRLADALQGTGVYIKVNSALRASGYGLIDELRERGLNCFADLKLVDIGETLATDGALLKEFRPGLLTVFCGAGVSAMKALKAALPTTEVLGVTILTSLTEEEIATMYRRGINAVVGDLAGMAEQAGLDGLIASPAEASMLRARVSDQMTINTPAVRPSWAIVQGDDQNPDRIMTPAKAIKAGADRIVVGRPILQAANPYEAVMRTLDEIAQAVG